MNLKGLKFYLTVVRHGQTIANSKKTIQGQSDTLLTELGIEQAQALAEHFKLNGPRNFDIIYTSDLTRAYKTCRIIADTCCSNDDKQLIINKDVRLRERKYGHYYEGKCVFDLKRAAYGYGYDDSNFTLFTPEGAESMEDVRLRVEDFFENTLSKVVQNNQEVLIVSHWATIKELLKIFQSKSNGSITDEHLIEAPNSAFSRFRISLTGNSGKSNACKSVATTDDTINMDLVFKQTIDKVDAISLHQTPHLRKEQISANLRGNVQ